MKLMIASDIHGSQLFAKMLSDRFFAENPAVLILLGDILYHGPRNSLPEGYDPQKTADILNDIKSSLICVRGNCDSEVDQMILGFPIMSDYALVMSEQQRFILTHGHIYSKDNPPPMKENDVMLFGHTHVPEISRSCGLLFINPGSVSIPKSGSPHSYMTIENGIALWKDLTGGVFKQSPLT